MPVRWDFIKCENFDALYHGLTQEDIDEYNRAKPDFIEPQRWCDAEHSPWFRPSDTESETLRALGEKNKWVLMARRSFVGNVMTVLMAVMPAPGWGLSEKNIDEAIKRILIYQQICGPLDADYLRPDELEGASRFWKDKLVTSEEIRLLVGMSVNFSTVTKPEFRKKVESWLWDKAKANDNKALREKQEDKVATG